MAQPQPSVGMVRNEHEVRQVLQLRYRVYVHEQGKRPTGVDRERGELSDPLDHLSYLWCARDGQSVVGTVAQTIIGPTFDLDRLPSALQLDRFPRSVGCLLGFSSRFAIAPEHRSTWVLPALARHSYAHGRALGGKFDVMATNPGLVPLFERLGYVRYTASAIHVRDVGLLIPMVLPATDHEHLRRVRSACLPSATHFANEPEWGKWLRAYHPMVGVYYGSALRRDQHSEWLAQRIHIPLNIATELCSMSFVHHFPLGTLLRRDGDRVTSTFFAMEGQVRVGRIERGDTSIVGRAPDGVEFSISTIRCETDAVVLCVPDAAIVRQMRRHPEHASRLQELLEQSSTATWGTRVFR